MIHPDTELRFKNSMVGDGVFATRPIPRGTVVWTLCDLDRRISPSQRAGFCSASRQRLDRYAYVDSAGDFILCWDHGRYVNHSCAPSMLSVGPEIEIAVRDLAIGDELTCEYGSLNLLEALSCCCGADACRGRIGPADVLQLHTELDQQSQAALRLANQVDQPLQPFIRNPRAFADWCNGTRPVPSHSIFHFARP